MGSGTRSIELSTKLTAWFKDLNFRFQMWRLDYCPKHLCKKEPPRYSFEAICVKCASEEREASFKFHMDQEARRRLAAEKLIKERTS
jgi:hypothetical protein